jgi:alanyl-tRNA synthetase
MRHAQLLGARDPMMFRLVPTLVREMGQAYPELVRAGSTPSATRNDAARRWSAMTR